MLSVDFWEQSHVSFTVIGDYFLLGDGSYGHLDSLKETVEKHVAALYSNTIDWQPIKAFLAENKECYGDNEDWQKVAESLPDDDLEAIMIATIAMAQKKGAKWLAKSKNANVRALVAQAGKGLKQLTNDRNACVRCEVARQGYALDILVNDFDPMVRRMVAKQGYALEKLSKDSITAVRCAVVTQGYKPELMVLDKSPHVRAEVARQGYFVSELEKESSPIVQKGVRDYHRSKKARRTTTETNH